MPWSGDVRVVLVSGESRELLVEPDGDVLHVTAHTGLSHDQVAAACRELGDDGPLVLAAWQRAVGFSG